MVGSVNMKVLIKFNNDFIQFFDYDEFKNPAYSRTNVLDLQEIVLSENFIMENYNFIVNFIKNKVVHDNINKVFIDKIKITMLLTLFEQCSLTFSTKYSVAIPQEL